MIRLKNRNTQFIKQYLNDGLTLDSFNAAYDNLDSYKAMMAEFNKIHVVHALRRDFLSYKRLLKGTSLPAVRINFP